MRPKSMILLAVAGLCGLIAAFTATKVMQAKDDNSDEIVMESIYVASADIDLGGLMVEEVVRTEEWPADKIPEGAVRSLDELTDRRTLVRLFPGEPILNAKLIEKDKWQDATQSIPAGYRVVAVAVDATSAAANLINPGHRVDVMVFLKPGRDTGLLEPKTATFLRDIKVFSVDAKTTVTPDEEDGTGIKAKNVSLLVTPQQAQKVSLASALGKIKLSLRREDDVTEDLGGEITLKDLLEPEGNQNEKEPKGDTGSITAFVEDMQDSDDSSVEDAEWEMTILSPNGATQFVWYDKTKLPELVGGAASSAPPAIPGAGGELPPTPTTGDTVPSDGAEAASEFDDGGAADWLKSNPLQSVTN